MKFKELPFDKRPDLTPYLIHLTRGTESEDGCTALDNLISILEDGEVWGSNPGQAPGYIKGKRPAACLMDIPFAALKHVCIEDNVGRYEPYGVVVSKRWAYDHGARPVLYLSDAEVDDLCIPDEELWRIVRLEKDGKHWISWLHEREWRCPDQFKLPPDPMALVEDTKDVASLQGVLNARTREFKSQPRAILPLNVIRQGLTF